MPSYSLTGCNCFRKDNTNRHSVLSRYRSAKIIQCSDLRDVNYLYYILIAFDIDESHCSNASSSSASITVLTHSTASSATFKSLVHDIFLSNCLTKEVIYGTTGILLYWVRIVND